MKAVDSSEGNRFQERQVMNRSAVSSHDVTVAVCISYICLSIRPLINVSYICSNNFYNIFMTSLENKCLFYWQEEGENIVCNVAIFTLNQLKKGFLAPRSNK